MKVIYLHQYFVTPEMSGGTRSFEMARRLVAKGHEVHMVTSYLEPTEQTDWFETKEEGINVHWFPVAYSNKMSFSERIKAFIKFAIASSKMAQSLQGDVVFATSTPLTIAIPGYLTARKNKIPMVFEVRDLWPELPIAMGALKNPVTKWLAKRLELFAYKNSQSIVALSPGMRDGILSTGYDQKQVAVIPNSSDNDLFEVSDDLGKAFLKQRGWDDERPLLVYTGTFGLINGVGYLVDLAVQLQNINSDIRILLVGSGKEYDLVKQKAKQHKVLETNLFIEPALPKKDIPALLNAATMASALFIDQPEMRANSANKFFDSLAASKPVFINYGGWMADLLNDASAGYVAWQKPLAQVAQELDECMHDKAWLERAAQSAKKLALEQFSRDILAEQLNDVLRHSVGEVQTTPEALTKKFYS